MTVVELAYLAMALASVLIDESLGSNIIAIVALALNMRCIIGESSALAALGLIDSGNRAIANTRADSGAGIDDLGAAAIVSFVENEARSRYRGGSIDSMSASAVRCSSAINNSISTNAAKRAAWDGESLAESWGWVGNTASAV